MKPHPAGDLYSIAMLVKLIAFVLSNYSLTHLLQFEKLRS